ncbi:MAG: GHKL domain-containing protein, partial [Lachnospiraceae bacterium]|nr:GHKL domain-containing protein [Lachnospiraceae bacterium]
LCTGTGIAAVGIGLLIINFFMFYLYNPLLHNMSKQFETELLEQKVQIYSNQLSVIMQSEERTKALRHDMKHHINELMILANENNSAEIRQYLEKMQDFLKNPEEIVSSGNLEIDSVLNYMLQRAKEELNTVNAKVLLPENMKHSFDLNVLLGNLLENAIEAARQTDKKYLSVDISLKKGIIFIKVDNSYLPEENLPQNQSTIQPILAASSRKHLGLGLKNIKRIIDAHDGSMEIIKNDGIFSVKAMLYTAKMK